MLSKAAVRLVFGLSAVLAAQLGSADPLAASDTTVDLELVLAVDVSVSMSLNELKIQRDGYVAALTDPDVLRAIKSGPHGRIAVSYFEWAGVTSQQLIVPWTAISGAEEAAAVAAKLERLPTWQPRRTSISGALDYRADLLARSPYDGIRQVIDVSGDGANNEGRPVTMARDAAVARGVAVNGLPVMAGWSNFGRNDVARLDEYYDNCVVGGPGAFVIAVNNWNEFPAAIRRKFLLEIAHKPARPIRPPVVLAQTVPPYDCEIGERLYRDDPFLREYNPENFQWPSNRPEDRSK
jgi:hypothetical protein